MDILCTLPPETLREIGAAPVTAALSMLFGLGAMVAIFLGL